MSEKRPKLWFEKEDEEFKKFEDIKKNFERNRLPGRLVSLPGLKMNSMPVGIINTDKELLLRARLPEFNKKDIRVKVTPKLVYISAAKEAASEKDNSLAKRSMATTKILELPVAVNTKNVKSRFREGLLEIVLEKV